MVSFLEAIQNEFWPYGKFSLTTFLNTVLTYRLISVSQKRNRERTLKVKILSPALLVSVGMLYSGPGNKIRVVLF